MNYPTRYFIVVLLLIIAKNISSQNNTFIKTFDYGFTNHANGVIQTPDKGYFIGGNQTIGIGLYWSLALKTDSLGNEIWHRIEALSEFDDMEDVAVAADGNYVSVGISVNNGGGDVLLVKYNQQGDVLWTQFYGYPNLADRGLSVILTSDSGFLLTGYTTPAIFEWADIYVIKTDSLGNEQWSRKISWPDIDVAYSGIETSDGNFLVAGYTYSLNPAGPIPDAFLWKLSPEGDSLWFKTYGNALKSEHITEVVQLNNGNIVMGGLQSQELYWDAYFILTDPEGNLINEINYGDWWDQSCNRIAYDPYHHRIGCIGTDFHGIEDPNDISLLVVNEDLDSLWKRNYQLEENINLYAKAICSTDDSGFAFTGGPGGEENCIGCIVFIKTDSLGCIIPGCELTSVAPVAEATATITIIPNPATIAISIHYFLQESQHIRVQLFDMTGRQAGSGTKTFVYAGDNEIQLEVAAIPAGMYLVQLTGNRGYTARSYFVKI